MHVSIFLKVARIDRIAEIPSDYLGSAGRIGMLTDRDVMAITRILNEIINER